MVALYSATETNIEVACELAAVPMLSGRFLGLSMFYALLAVGLDLRHQMLLYHTDILAVSPELESL